ncbi:MAG: hypothetical protein H6Q68_2561 [Firmicutes bacterium]|nr:hypothetical protein [Bacillota bacterium]
MGKNVVSVNWRRFVPVGQDAKCVNCPSTCRTTCVRDDLPQTSYGSKINRLKDYEKVDKESPR